MLSVRLASPTDIPAITVIYNQGIEDGVATLEHSGKGEQEMRDWFGAHDGRYPVILATRDDEVVGWASLNRYSHRCADDGVADLSIYVRRDQRGRGVGAFLMEEIERRAIAAEFHKIVLFALAHNAAGRRTYERSGFREVGIFQEQGKLHERFVDVLIMEKLLKNS